MKMNAIETDKRGPTQQIFHKVVEPSLGNLKLDFYPHHHSVRLHTAFYPQQSHCQLESESVEYLPRPRTHPIIKHNGMLPKIAKKNAVVKRSPSRSGSIGSVSQTKELPLLTSRSLDRGSHLLPRNTKKAMSVCSQYRYLGPSKALQSQSTGSHDEEESKSEQVRRFEGEQKTLEHTRHLKRVSEIATYQHRVDRMYYMCGSKVPLHGKYTVDNAELEKLRAFSIARSQSRASSARRSASGGRIRDYRSSFVSGTDEQSDPGLTIDIVAGTVIKSPGSGWEGKEKSSSEVEGATGADGDTFNGVEQEGDPAHSNSPGKEGHTSDAVAAGSSAETSTDVHNVTLKSDGGPAGDGNGAHQTFVTEEISQETDSPQEQEGENGRGLSRTDGRSSMDIQASAQEGETSKQSDDVNTISGELNGEVAGNREQSVENLGQSHSHHEDGEDDDDGNDGEVNDDSPRDSSKDAEDTEGVEQSVTEENSLGGSLKANQEELGFGIVLDKTPYYATKKQIYNNTTFDNPALKQFEDLATLSKGDEDGLYDNANLHLSEQSRDDGRGSFVSNQSDALIAQMEDEVMSKDHLSDTLSRVGHLEDSALDEDLLGEEAEGETNWENGVYGTVLNDEERKKREEMKEKRQREKEAAKERQRKKQIKDETPAVPRYRKLSLTDIYSFITARQRMIFQKKFQDLDVDGNGKITLKELTQRMNKGAKKEQLKEFMKVFDLNKDKTIDEREFVTVAALNDKLQGHEIVSENSNLQLNLRKLALHVTAYKEIFEMTDQDRNGYLSLEEVMFVISVSVGTEIGTDKEILDYIFKNLDVNGSGSIDFIEFLSFIPFFLKLHQEIVGRPASIEDIMKANAAVKEALSRK